MDAGRRYPRASTSGNKWRRQPGRPGLHRGNLSAAASPASVDLGVRGGATTLGREVVTGARDRGQTLAPDPKSARAARLRSPYARDQSVRPTSAALRLIASTW